MAKYFFLCLFIFSVSACSLFATGSKSDIRNYEDLEKTTLVKYSEIDCNFNNIVSGIKDEYFCSNNKDLDYVSYFTSFNFQALPNTLNDYIINLLKQLDKDKKKIEKSLVYTYFYNKDKVNVMYENIGPLSFVIENNNKLAVFISRNDILLRSNIYPSLKFHSLIEPEDNEDKNNLYLYKVKYLIYPHLLTADYSSDWISSFLGLPNYSDAEKLFEEGNKNIVIEYFRNLEHNSSMNSNVYLEGSKLSFFELARSFVFSDKIYKSNINNKNVLKPALPKDNEGFVNEYLPSYVLSKIEIIKKDKNGNELVLNKWVESDINDMILNKDDISGFYSVVDKSEDKLIIRYTHNSNKPRYRGEGYMRSNMSGLSSIYENLRNTIVTDINVTDYFRLKDLPIDCIKEAKIEDLINGSNMTSYDKDKIFSIYSDSVSKCSSPQIIMTKVLFYRDLNDGKIIN